MVIDPRGFNFSRGRFYYLKVIIAMYKKMPSILQNIYLNNYIFYGLKNINTGFDVSTIAYFSEADFEIVLHRVRQYGLGIYGIEPWKNGKYFDVLCYESFSDDATDHNWYMQAFEKFKNTGEQLQYSATYFVPESIQF